MPAAKLIVIYPTPDALQACAASQGGRGALAHAHTISNGGAPIVLIAEEDVVTFPAT